MLRTRHTTLSLLSMLLASTAYAPAIAQETQPGDACTAGETGFFRRTGDNDPGPAITGQNFMFCDGSNWISFLHYDDPTASLLFGAPAAAPADGTFNNSEWTLWLDETNDEFELKAKKSNGTVINATVGGGSGLWTDNTSYISYQSTHLIKTGQALPGVMDDNGARMFFYPDKSALRGGEIKLNNDAWQDANIGASSIAWGDSVQANGANSIATGHLSTASGTNSVALGFSTTASGNQSLALGYGNTASASEAFAIGYYSIASGIRSIAMGAPANATATASVAIGANTTASGTNSVAIGTDSTASGVASLALGWEAIAGNGTAGSGFGDYSMAIGLGNASTATLPRVTGDNSLGIFMGDQQAVDVDDNTTMAIVGGDFVVGSPQLADTGNSAHDKRMLFDQSQGAFRAGKAAGSQWDSANVGLHSVAMGSDTRATGSSSIALGRGAYASRQSSVALGHFTNSTGYSTFAAGKGTTANGYYSVAMGSNTVSDGNTSFAMGYYSYSSGAFSQAVGVSLTASGTNSIALGRRVVAGDGTAGSGFGDFSMAIGLGNASGPWANRPRVTGDSSLGIFMGDQQSVDITANTRMALVGGDFMIDDDGKSGSQGCIRYVNGTGLEYSDDCSSWTAFNSIGGGIFELNSGVVRNTGAHATEDFVFGSTQLADTTDANHDSRVFFDKSKGAFRAGTVTGAEWDDASVGSQSVAMGRNTTASGSQSVAMGDGADATGNYGFAMGYSTIASGNASVAMGAGSDATAYASVAMGYSSEATSSSSVAIGNNNEASGTYSTAIGGYRAQASGNRSVAMGGYRPQATGYASVAIGGFQSDSTGTHSVAMGGRSFATGNYGIAMGYQTTASGVNSIALGLEVIAGNGTAGSGFGDNSMAIGLGASGAGNDPRVTGDSSLGIFMGDQTDANLTANNRMGLIGGDLMIDDNGAAGSQGCIRYVNGTGLEYSDDCSSWTAFNTLGGGGGGVWEDVSGTGVGPIRSTNGTISFASADFVFGSTQLADTGDANHDSRMWFDKSKSAFRAGRIASTEWDDSNVGFRSVAMGYNTTADGNAAFAIGDNTTSSGNSSVAMGANTTASGGESFAQGYGGTTASGSRSVAMGWNVTASSINSIAMGRNTVSSGSSSVAMGYNNTASAQQSVAMGGNANATGLNAVAMGWTTTASGGETLAVGHTAIASGFNSIALGREVLAGNGTAGNNVGDHSMAIGLGIAGAGNDPRVTGDSSFGIFMGDQTNADVDDNTTAAIVGGDFVVGSTQLADTGNTAHDRRMWFDLSKGAFRAGRVTGSQWNDSNVGVASIALGYNNTASGGYSFAAGELSVASGNYSTASGWASDAIGNFSTAIGNNNTASGTASVALGQNTTASGGYSFAAGELNQASGNYSAAMGWSNVASGNYSFSVGENNDATGHYSVATGWQSLASQRAAVAMGWDTTASGVESVAMGDTTVASAPQSIAMGLSTTASGNQSVALGRSTTASGGESLALGYNTTASGKYSIALGREAIAGNGTPLSNFGDHSMAIGLGDASTATYPRVTGDNSLGIFMGDQQGVNVSTSNVMVVMGGNLGIGTTSPGASLEVVRAGGTELRANATGGTDADLAFAINGTDQWTQYADDSDGALHFQEMTTTTTVLRLTQGGLVAIGTAAPSVELDVTGDIEYTGTIADVSDRRLKTDIAGLPEGQLEKLLQLEGVSFKMKSDPDGPTEFGFIAQDVEPLYASLVHQTGDDGMLSLNYVGLIAPMVEAIKEQNELIKKQSELIEQLEARLKALEDAQ